jgi:glycosyltransferase involved in cell wall biosynthesis
MVSNPPPVLVVRAWYSLRRFLRFVVRLERSSPEVVLLFAAVGASLVEKGAMAWYARLRGIPAVMFPRGGGIVDEFRASAWTRAWVRVAFAGARKVFCQSPRFQAFVENDLRFPHTDAPVIPNWTATSALLELGRRRRPRPSGPVRLLFLGWLDKEKGIEELLQACLTLAPTRLFTLTLAGEGNMSASARDTVERAGLSDRIQFLGWQRGSAVEECLRDADVLVLPSWAEGLPNAMIEAMAAGLAVVVTHVGSVPDVVADGEEALVVPPRDVTALTGAIGRVIDEPALRARLGAAAHALAAERFNVEAAVDLMVGEFQTLRQINGALRRRD